MGIKQSTLADAAPNPHAAHARLHRALEAHWHPHHTHALRGHVTHVVSSTVTSTLLPIFLNAPLGPLPEPVAQHLAAMVASFALIDFQIQQLGIASSSHSRSYDSTPSSAHSAPSASLAIAVVPSRALRLAINARPLARSSPKSRDRNRDRDRTQSQPQSQKRPSTAATNPANATCSFLDSPISYTTLLSAVSHLLLALDVPGLPLHTPDLPSARLPSSSTVQVAHTRRISPTTAANRTGHPPPLAHRGSLPSHASPRATKSSKSPLILAWLAPHVHFAHIVQLALATLGSNVLLPAEPIPLVAHTCTVDDLAQILALAVNLWAAASLSVVTPILDSLSDASALSPNLTAPSHTLVSPSSLHPHPHRISGGTLVSRHPPHRPGSFFSTLSSTSGTPHDPQGVLTPGNASVFTDHGSTLPDLETRTLRGQWDGGGVRAASLLPVRSMTLSSDLDDDDDDDDDDEDPDDTRSVASSVEPLESPLSSSTPAGPPPLPPDVDPATTSRSAAAAAGTSPQLAAGTLSVTSTTHTRHRAGSMTSTTAVFHLRMGDLEDPVAPPPHPAPAAAGVGHDRHAPDRWSLRSHYPAPSVLSATAPSTSTYHYHAPAAAAAAPRSPRSPVTIPPSALRPLAHRLVALAGAGPTAATDWDALVRLVLWPLLPHMWTWALGPYLGQSLLDAPPPCPGSSGGQLDSHILPVFPTPAAGAARGPLLPASLIAHWLVHASLVAPRVAPVLAPLVGHVTYRASAHGWTEAAAARARGGDGAADAVVALVALAVPLAGATHVDPVVVVVDISPRGAAAAAAAVVSPASLVQRVVGTPGAPVQPAQLVHVPGVVSVDLEQQLASVWVAERRGDGGLWLPVDVGGAVAAPGAAACLVLPVLDVEVIVYT